MSKGRDINKLNLVRQHRETWYYRSLDRLIEDKATPDEVTERRIKANEVYKHKRGKY